MAIRASRGRQMTELELKSVVEAELRSSNGWVGGEISEFRREGLQYYFGEKFGNEIDGRSSFISTDVQDVVESIMPDMMDIFGSGETVVQFEPVGPEDVPNAEQATDYVNFIWTKDNPGFEITHDWMKDAILQKNGIIRVDWDETPKIRRETIARANVYQIAQLEADPHAEIVEQREVEPETPEEMEYSLGEPLFDIVVERVYENGRVKVHSLPPEEFLISRRATDLDNALLTCHKVRKTISELLEMGYPQKLLDRIPSHDEQDYNEERVSRFNLDDEWPDNDESPDEAARDVWLYDCYVHIDFDGDGRTELRKVVVAGPGYTVLPDPETGDLALEVDDHPFVDITPIRMPHKFFGRSLHELVRDIQFIKSTVIRQLLDNMYLVNNQRALINERVSLDDWLTNRPGGAVRVMGSGPVADSWAPVQQGSLGSYVYPLLEYLDGVREMRTGITRYNQGLDPQSLNKTATGINLLLGQTQKRLLMIARLFAETGFKKAFKKILRLTINHQDRPRTIRLRNEWVPIDPAAWNADMDLTVRVGLGFGTKEGRLAMLDRLMLMAEKIVAYQGGVQGPLITLDNIHEIFRQYINSSGLKPAGLFITDPNDIDPEQMQQMMDRPDPETEKIKIESELKREEMQMEDQRKREEMMLEHQRKMDELKLKAQQMGVEANLKESETRLKETESLSQLQIKRYEALSKAVGNGGQGGNETEGEGNEVSASVFSAASIMDAANALAEAARAMSGPKEVIRDERGRVVGMRPMRKYDA